jgi:hypothetical protein
LKRSRLSICFSFNQKHLERHWQLSEVNVSLN